jgi:acyl carrier protein
MSAAQTVVAFLQALRAEKFSEDRIMKSVDLFKDGVLDSLSTLNLIHFLEAHFDLVLGPFAVTRKNFSSVPSIVALVENARSKSGLSN